MTRWTFPGDLVDDDHERGDYDDDAIGGCPQRT